MIYLPTSPDDPIRQGDIFRGIPRIDVGLDDVPVLDDDGQVTATRWEDLPQVKAGTGEPISAVLGVRPVVGIVLTQECDAVRSPDLTLAEVMEFKAVERSLGATIEGSDTWVKRLVQQAKINQKWFYLPRSQTLGFSVAMGADFRSTLRVGREDLERMRAGFRIGRLNDVASEHFRERIAEFFRRYAYDEWYPLSKEEFEIYKKQHPGDIEAFEWQK